MYNSSIKQKEAQCVDCVKQGDETEKKVIGKPPRCSSHYWKHRAKKKGAKGRAEGKVGNNKPIANRSKKGQKVASEDRKFFESIWKERSHNCTICGCNLGDDYNPVFFSHILTKGAYPKFRHNKDNILLMCHKHHHEYEFADRSTKEFRTLFKRALLIHGKLIIKYYEKSK